ncbi:MAG: hypothetical protein JW881_12420 [Spirochaetales bacterium]|nr:hypothetical protein [Spirochaetales bacterium]
MKKYFKPFGIVLWLVLFLAGCPMEQPERLYKETLFTIYLGKLEDQIDLFQLNGGFSNAKNDFYMRDGMFYIANTNSSKIMQFTSYGDLLFILYNPDPAINPQPVILQTEDIEGKVTNRYAARFGLQHIGVIAVDSEHTIYVEDSVPEDQAIEDEENGIVLNSRILRFTRLGELIDFIGQDGVGGTPFPFIYDIHVTKNDELVVVSKIPEAWIVFWFTKEGRLLFTERFDLINLPNEKNYIASLTSLIPDYKEYFVFLHASYSSEEIDQSTKTKITIKNRFSRIYAYDIEKKKYSYHIQVPDAGKRKYQSGFGEVEMPLPSYEFIGVNERKLFYLIRPDVTSDYQLIVMDRKGDVLSSRYLIIGEYDDSELYIKQISLSYRGIISGLLCFNDHVEMIWWRTDRGIKGIGNE